MATKKEIKKVVPTEIIGITVVDLGRNKCKSSTVYYDNNTKKAIGANTINIPSKLNVVDPEIIDKTTPVTKITRDLNGDKVTTYYTFGKHAVSDKMKGVDRIVSLEGELHVLENIDTFIAYSWIKSKCVNEKKLDNAKLVPVISISLTRDMESKSNSDKVKTNIANTKYTITDYPNGLGGGTEYTEVLKTKSEKFVRFNVQGSGVLYAHLMPNLLNNDFSDELKNAGTFVERSDISCNAIIDRFISSDYSDNYVSLDFSSKEMTINLHIKNTSDFKTSKTIQFGTYNVYMGMLEKLKKMCPSKQYNLESVTQLHLNKEVIRPMKHDEYVAKFNFKDEYSANELYAECFDEQFDMLWDQVKSAYIDILGEYKNANPKFVVLGGGGMLANGNLQTPFMKVAFEMVKLILPEYEVLPELKAYEVIVPHGLNSTNNYLYTDIEKGLTAHVRGIARSLIIDFKKKLK